MAGKKRSEYNSDKNSLPEKGFKPDREYILSEAEKIFSYRHFMTASFLSEKYGIDDPDFLLTVLSFSLLLDEGHIRISIENMNEELEKYFSLNVRQHSHLTSLLLKTAGNISRIIEKYPDVFKDPSSLFRTPFIVLDSGKTVTSEKLFKLEKNTVDLVRQFIKSSSGFAGNSVSGSEAEEAVKIVEKKSGFVFEERQREAVLKSLELPFLILTGGPGTGKTTTVVSIVKAMIEAGRIKGEKKSIALCAPTGRAANRMEELIEKEGLQEEVEKPQTLHRLLRLSSDRSRYKEGFYLPYDAVITDESSMIDLQMMKHLFEALSPETSIVMAGDADQLPSVEAGAVFADFLAGSDESSHILKNNVVRLDRMKRAGAGIAETALRIKEKKFSVSDIDKYSSFLSLKPLDEKIIYADLVSLYINREKEGSFFEIMEKNGVLTTTNRGPFGMDSINRTIKEAAGFGRVPYYQDMPLMVLKNDYRNMVFNGDRAVVVEKDGIYTAVFKTGSGALRYIPVPMLNDWTVSYAQTVHKSQGSEFENVYIILDKYSERILTNEILYTAVTRAKKKIIIYSDEDTLETAMSRNIYRNSGIRDAMKRRLECPSL